MGSGLEGNHFFPMCRNPKTHAVEHLHEQRQTASRADSPLSSVVRHPNVVKIHARYSERTQKNRCI